MQLSLEFLDFERARPLAADLPTLQDELDGACPTHGSSGDSMCDLLAGSLRIPFGIVKQVRDLLSPTPPRSRTPRPQPPTRSAFSSTNSGRHGVGPVAAVELLCRHLEVATAPLAELACLLRCVVEGRGGHLEVAAQGTPGPQR